MGAVLRLECQGCDWSELVEEDEVRERKPVRDWWVERGRLCENCQHVTVAHVKTMARNVDPDSAKLAAALVYPKVGTRKGKVLARLESAQGEWVAGEDIANPAVGGSEGLKRLRELRADGFPVEEKPPPGGEGMWWYRLAGSGPGGWEWSAEQGSYHPRHNSLRTRHRDGYTVGDG